MLGFGVELLDIVVLFFCEKGVCVFVVGVGLRVDWSELKDLVIS